VTPDLRELYQEVILDHGRKPRNFRALDEPCVRADGHNPLCGDRITVYARIADQAIVEVTFEGTGCAICMASASLMTQALRGVSREESQRKFEALHDVVTGVREPEDAADELGKLGVLAGVRQYPVRIKCATLAWHTLRTAMSGAQQQTVSTE